MNSTNQKELIKQYSKRILLSRFRILDKNGFYGILLMHTKFELDSSCKTAYTDGYKICFSPKFMDQLSDKELDFVMMHEILHIVLKHCFRGSKVDNDIFNIACDIVVNSNILYSNNMDLSTITIGKYGISMHLINGEEGYKYTAEEVYEKLIKNGIKSSKGSNNGNDSGNSDGSAPGTIEEDASFDDHSHWSADVTEEDEFVMDEWEQRMIQAADMISVREPSVGTGKIPLAAERVVGELRNPTVDWKTLLQTFLSFEIGDYSFLPPDRRLDGPFFMPDFNGEIENEEDPKGVYFMIDTSGSISDNDIITAYSEIKGALEQFPSLKGYLGFFDAFLYGPTEFENVDDLIKIRPKGGGGTSFFVIFDYIRTLEEKPKAIVILTDGYAPFPSESARMDIPVIWLINNDKVTPPWGTVARMISKK